MMKMILVWPLLLPVLALAGEAAQTLVPTELKQQPFADAPTLGSLAARAPVDVLRRQGGWMQVKAPEQPPGWVKLTHIQLLRTGEAAQADSGMAALWNAATQGRSGNTGVTVATGVRGLTLEAIQSAQAAPGELPRLEAYAASRADAESFARSAQLAARQIDYLAVENLEGTKK